MSFEFINNAAIDHMARRRIRSHVAKGKNVGKILPPRRKQLKRATPAHLPVTASSTLGPENDEVALVLDRGVGDNLAACWFPIVPNQQSRKLILKGSTNLGGANASDR